MGIDGSYVHAREGTNRKAGSFEVIVGKSMTEEGPSRRFGFVHDYDSKPKRRLYETLISQGMQMNQQVIFLSDGGDTVRDLDEMEDDLEWVEEPSAFIQKLLQAVHEFNVYITTNQSFLVNYGDRYRNGETISTAFVESTVNEVISKRFVKRQHMRWTRRGAHHLLQVRVQALNQTLRETFCRWYPHLSEVPSPLERGVSS